MERSKKVTRRGAANTVEVAVRVRVSQSRPGKRNRQAANNEKTLLRRGKNEMSPEEIGLVKGVLNAMGETGIWADEELVREVSSKVGEKNLEILHNIGSELKAGNPIERTIRADGREEDILKFASRIFLKASPVAAKQFFVKQLGQKKAETLIRSLR
jgi:hypothetical protein